MKSTAGISRPRNKDKIHPSQLRLGPYHLEIDASGMASYTMDAEITVSSYKGIGIDLRPLEIKRGGWIADFTLIQVVGSKTVETPYAATVTFPTRELANLAALDSARSIIEENLWRSLPSCPKAPMQGHAASTD